MQTETFNLDLYGKPRVDLFTLGGTARAERRYAKFGCCGVYGHVVLDLAPIRAASHYVIEWAVTEEVIPIEFFPGVVAGIREVADQWMALRYPVVGVMVRVVGGSEHPVDSRVSSYRVASYLAFTDAVSRVGLTPLTDL